MNFEAIRKKYKLSLILMHGSQITGKIHPESDTDIAFVREKTKIKINYLELLVDLTKLIKKDKIDLVDITHANPLLLFAITSKSKLLAGSLDSYNNLSHKAFNLYSDYLPYLKMEAEFVKERINSYAKN
ncbi:MAG: polymerase beta domain protein region protein [Candidatus Woesebacteria bacterium GW2011_GWA1_33_30]|uniref:Polymerase beta domain protein region protein n=1 Tax=Candidatus Woesebacteria bacterium GW2011_GWA2_33_28 TaxID=1618561 RepID=A0A0G0AAE4_9BACT|nr:MAG: polymerase beta domain protein region protein [Candidatus Woesebacteria bacterium GW2011_GWA2_33_28]KKP49023.1 MAG: polymerase beta domain protein region protein [Candidatus Woesebacteria bacterium GW2011_GWA1_33_30]KKP49869.1 MAG: polymerase beta domain protein region protein [Microgenomates group bacterium GW2011_GWC1_33_32]KKP52615.1 MAG: polymerase beta domain protein region protein [Candidatus Woesebacteria bacterium GW2011_GWB1_33_38]KKP56675.1 MAG: polymerase beta domain protein 